MIQCHKLKTWTAALSSSEGVLVTVVTDGAGGGVQH